MALADDVIEFMQGEREPIAKSFVARELAKLSACKLWPEASESQWRAAIDEAVISGGLVETDGNVRLAPPATQEVTKQLELF